MKKNTLLLLLATILFAGGMTSCKKDENTKKKDDQEENPREEENKPPLVSITSPLVTDVFTAPATVTITADASDSDGTISKVEFYNQTTKIGEASMSPYSFVWNDVQSGTYSLTTKATDNNNSSTTSEAVVITVNEPEPSPGTTGWCGIGSGVGYTEDLFEWKAETTGSNVKVTLHPIGKAEGSDFALMIVNRGGEGGHPMTLEPSGDLTYTYNDVNGTEFEFYFVYKVGAGGMETNNVENPIIYTVGTDCTGAL